VLVQVDTQDTQWLTAEPRFWVKFRRVVRWWGSCGEAGCTGEVVDRPLVGGGGDTHPRPHRQDCPHPPLPGHRPGVCTPPCSWPPSMTGCCPPAWPHLGDQSTPRLREPCQARTTRPGRCGSPAV